MLPESDAAVSRVFEGGGAGFSCCLVAGFCA
jgi:hypothetical protein